MELFVPSKRYSGMSTIHTLFPVAPTVGRTNARDSAMTLSIMCSEKTRPVLESLTAKTIQSFASHLVQGHSSESGPVALSKEPYIL